MVSCPGTLAGSRRPWSSESSCPSHLLISYLQLLGCRQGWKLKPKPKPENPVLKEIFETQTEADTYLAKILKT